MLCLTPRVFFCNVALRPQRPYGLLGNGAQDVHLDSQSAHELHAAATIDDFDFQRMVWVLDKVEF